jgi:hypothetical protein
MPKQFSRFAVKVLIVPLALCSASFANQTAYAQIQTPPSDKKEARKVDEFGDIYT